MNGIRPLTRHLALAFGGSLALLCTAVYAQDAQKQERIEVTGSNIKRVSVETVAPVEIITREQIERTGQPTIAEVLRNIPSNTGGSFGESFSNSFAPGAAGISLRGLGQKTTLVLINGRRTAGYGFAQNLQDTFVDLNSIPSSAVERVEILKDGASAIYGSDAIAGVVNIILRQDYKGAEVSGGAGNSEGKNDYRFSLTGGTGDLAVDKFTAFGVLDVYKRDLMLMSDTKFGASRDFRSYPGGRNFVSLTGGGTWRQLTAAGAFTNTYRAISGCGGTVLTGPQAAAAGLINLTPPPGQSTAGYNTNVATAAATNTFCSKDFDNQFTALPKTDRIGFLGRVNVQLGAAATGYAELGLSRNKSFQTFQSPFFAGTTGLQQTAAGLRPYPYNITFAPGVAGNPFTTNARYVGVLNDLGTRDTEITSDTYRVLVGAKYSLGSFDLDSGIGASRNSVQSFNTNRLSKAGVSGVFGVPTTPQPPTPVSTATAYSLDNPAANSAAVRGAMSINFPRKSDSDLQFFDTKASTTLGQLPGGDIGLALGLEYRREKLRDRPDPRAQAGDILGQGITSTDGSRNSTAVFAELALPLTKQIEGQLALRTDRYSDYGSSTTPKVGIKFAPNSEFLVRANWGKGFRAPTLPEISPSVATFFTGVQDPVNGTSPQISGVFAGNPNLKAETSESFNLGMVFSPTKDLSFGIDAYKIRWQNIVAAPSFQSIVNACATQLTAVCVTPNGTVLRDTTSPNAPVAPPIVSVFTNYVNQASTKTDGIDFDARWTLATEYGKFTTRANVTYIMSYEEDGTEVAGTNGGTNTIPRIKGGLSLDWDRGAWSVTGRVNYIHEYSQELLPGSYFTKQDPRFQNGVYPNNVPSYTTLDLFAKYQVTKDLAISGAVLNVTNKTPPYDPGFSGTFLYDFSQYDIRGRQVRVGFTYKIK